MLLHARSEEAGSVLKEKLLSLVGEGPTIYGAAPNLMKILETLSTVYPQALAPIAAAADEFYGASVHDNEFHDALSRILCNLYDSDSDLVPETLQATVREFLEDEDRFSVVDEANRLLERIED